MTQNAKKKPWTVMIYLVGDNDLSDEMIWALKEMYRVGTGNSCHVVVQFDPKSPYYGPRGYNIGELEGKLGARADLDGIIEMDALKDTRFSSRALDPEISSDKKVLEEFLKWTFENAPADYYMLVLSGHGSGAGGYFLQDSDPEGRLTTADFGDVVKTICKKRKKRIDILGLDCCAMSTAELGYEVQDVVGYIVGAEGFTHNAGWPYHRVLEALRKSPPPGDLATELVENYFYYYSDYLAAEVSADQSAIHLENEGWRGLVGDFRKLSRMLIHELETENEAVKNAVILAHWSAQSFEYEQNVDLYDFCSRLKIYSRQNWPKLAEMCDRIIEDKRWQSVVPRSLYSGPEYQHAHGISLYFPWSEITAGYDKLGFGRKTAWNQFLKIYIRKTCREIRNANANRGVKPKTLEPKYDDKFIGPGGWPAYRATGLDHFNSKDLESIRGGARKPRLGGGSSGVRGGGPDFARGGGPDFARTMARLSSMKNFPAGFYQPEKRFADEHALKNGCVESTARNIFDAIHCNEKAVLQSALGRLSDEKKRTILEILIG